MTDFIDITVFPDLKGQMCAPQRLEILKLQAFPPEAEHKHSLPLLKLCRFGNHATQKGCLRWDGNILALTGAELDYDEGIHPLEYAAKRLTTAGIEAFFYSSPSHCPEAPRWRCLLPFSEDANGTVNEMREYRSEAVRQAEAALGFAVAIESYTLSQGFYFGRVTGTPYQTAHISGERIDTLYDLCVQTQANATVSGYVPRDRLDIKEAVKQIVTGEHFHDPMLRLSASYIYKGMAEADVIHTLQGFMELAHSQDTERWQDHYNDISRTVASAVQKFSPPSEQHISKENNNGC